jgi:hypothetical protein
MLIYIMLWLQLAYRMRMQANNINKEEEIKSALDYINYEVKKFIETPYTTEDNV